MCGRYELHTQPAALALAFGVPFPPQMRPRYNIAPMQDVPVVRTNRDGERELAQVRWGLVPRWAKDPSIGARMINARAETLEAKPAFRNALKWHRCLLPADGFSAIVSARAFIIRVPIDGSFAQRGTRPQRTSTHSRSPAAFCRTIGTSCVGAML